MRAMSHHQTISDLLNAGIALILLMTGRLIAEVHLLDYHLLISDLAYMGSIIVATITIINNYDKTKANIKRFITKRKKK